METIAKQKQKLNTNPTNQAGAEQECPRKITFHGNSMLSKKEYMEGYLKIFSLFTIVN